MSERPHRILVVDDSPFTGDVIAHALRKAGFEVDVARDLWDLERPLPGKPDLVLLDVVLQEAFGDDLAPLLRGSHGFTCPIVLISSLPETELAQRAEEAQLDGFIAKHAGLAAIVARAGVPVILMHMRGEPATMQQHAQYDDVVAEVGRELTQFVDDAIGAGIDRAQILVDPGIGFAKTAEHNLEILAHASELAKIAPLVIGASRKKFIGTLTGRDAGPDRLAGSLAALAAAHRAGATLVRVHDVRPTVDFLKVLNAIAEREP